MFMTSRLFIITQKSPPHKSYIIPNNIHTNLRFKLAVGTKASINFLDIFLHRINHGFEIEV